MSMSMKILRCPANTTQETLLAAGLAVDDLLAIAEVRVTQAKGSDGRLVQVAQPANEVLVYLRAGAYVSPKVQGLVLEHPPL